MELYTYYRSTSSYRVRIALALKGLAYQSLPVNLLQGEQRGEGYVAVNPQGRVPALRTDGGEVLVQSPAIIEYLEEVYPQPALLPATAEARAKVRGVAAIIGCDIHPLHNVSVLNRLRQAGQDEGRSTSGSATGSAKGSRQWSNSLVITVSALATRQGWRMCT